MSILIKGMEMPRNCLECELYGAMYSSGCDVASLGIPKRYNYDPHTRPDWCPLVELPEKHGRLIDADAFAEFIEGTIKRQHYEDVTIDEILTVADVLTAVIDDLKGNTIVKYESNPTVIEAEGER